MRSIADLADCAPRHVGHYVHPSGARAFQTYDVQGDPQHFGPLDALAPGLLDASVKGSIVIAMFAGQPSAYAELRAAIQHLLGETADLEPRFEEIDLDDADGSWELVRSVLRNSDATPGLKAAKVTKMLHRKRPHFVPIFDSKVAAFYGTTARTPWQLWPRLQADLRDNKSTLGELASGVETPDGRPLSLLRALDISIWEHVVTGCDGT